MLQERIKKLAKDISDKVIADRRYLHRYPELSFGEFKTAEFIRAALSEMEVDWQPVAQTGTIAIIKGKVPSDSVIALRADIDALPIEEKNDTEYASQNKGIMHACGHDVHTASLLGVARILQSVRNDFGGTVKLIFQPGEEMLPGGAEAVIREGGLDKPVPEVVIGQHVAPWLECGKVAFRKGRIMASMDEITINVFGKGGHGAEPHKSIDPVAIASTLILALQQLVSRNADPQTPSVLSIGKLVALGAINVIPDSVLMEGTFRTLEEEWRCLAHEKIKSIAISVVEGMGGECAIDIRKGYPCLYNDESITEKMISYSKEYCGADNVTEASIWMASEDFSYYAQKAPSCFYLLGVGNQAKGIQSGLHTPSFDVDETALQLSAGLMTYIALKVLEN